MWTTCGLGKIPKFCHQGTTLSFLRILESLVRSRDKPYMNDEV